MNLVYTRPTVDQQLSVSKLYSVNWFFLIVLSSGALGALQIVIFGDYVPLELVARLALFAQSAVVLIAFGYRKRNLPADLSLALLILGLSMAVPFSLSVLSGDELGLSIRRIYFMYNVAVFLFVLYFIPFRLSLSLSFSIIFSFLLGYGIFQTITQELYLPASLVSEWGILFEYFWNERLRVVSFFPSSVRFSEMLAFLSCIALFKVLAGTRHALFWIIFYAAVVWVLYNTYSRSGYILLVSSNMLIIFSLWREILRDTLRLRALFYIVIPFAIASSLAIFLFTNSGIDVAVLDQTSLIARHENWAFIQKRLEAITFFEFLFGTGEAAMFSRSEPDYFALDNVYLAMALYGGLLGLLAFLLLFVAIFRTGLTFIRVTMVHNLQPLLAFYLGLLAEGLFVDNHNTVFLTQFAILTITNQIWSANYQPCLRDQEYMYPIIKGY